MTTQAIDRQMQAKLVEKPAFTIVGMVTRTKPGDPSMMQLWMDFDGQKERVRGQVSRGVFYGASDNYDPQTTEFDYLAGVAVKPGQAAPEGMVAWEIPAQTYAVFETTLAEIGDTIGYIYGPWMAGSDFQRTHGPDFELYEEDFDGQDPSSKVYVHIPVKEK
ncbi:MAG: GyrI-like domain-containing protein [Caldilineaceae bacterium]